MKVARFSESFSKKGFFKKKALRLIEEQIKVEWYGALALGDFDPERMPGVKEYGEAFVCDSKMELIKEKTLEAVKTAKIDDFWLEVNRTGNHDFNSMEVAKTAGKYVEEHKHNAISSGKIVSINIHQKKTIVFVPKKGLGGLPMGLYGKAGFIWDGSYKSQLALVKLACRGFKPIVLAFGEGEPLLGEVIKIDQSDADYQANHALKGMKGPVMKAWMYLVASKVRLPFFATGEVIGSGADDDPDLLYRIEKFTGLHPVRPIGFLNMSDVRHESRLLGLEIKESQKVWKQFKTKALEEEWISLEMGEQVNRVKKHLLSKSIALRE